MNKLTVLLITSSIAMGVIVGCGGPSKKEKQRRKQERQDSLEQVRQQRLAQMRKDSIQQARKDSIAAAKKRKRKLNRIKFDSDGNFAVQVESWRSKDKADGQLQKWEDRGYENAYTVKMGNEATGNIWFRVRLGHMSSKEMAQKLKDKLQRKYQEPSWVSMTTSDVISDTTDSKMNNDTEDAEG